MMVLKRQKIIIVNYGMGNLGSIHNMLRYIGYEASISADTDEIMGADKLILSGVGSFDGGMKNLNEGGFLFPLEKKVLDDKIPVLGICLGMQLFSKRSEEGRLPGLGWLNAETVRFSFGDNAGNLKIPHMGWNTVTIEKNGLLFNRMPDDFRFYFVHSFHLLCANEEDILGCTFHGYKFASAIIKGNIYGVQFHPEKSHRFGMQILRNFAELI
jgi:glutamine amidotransferase